MPRFGDCESCAFYHVEDAICDECEDADQWEPDDTADFCITPNPSGSKTLKFIKHKYKEAA